MDVLARALDLESAGHHVCHLEVGQPQSGAPSKVNTGIGHGVGLCVPRSSMHPQLTVSLSAHPECNRFSVLVIGAVFG